MFLASAFYGLPVHVRESDRMCTTSVWRKIRTNVEVFPLLSCNHFRTWHGKSWSISLDFDLNQTHLQ